MENINQCRPFHYLYQTLAKWRIEGNINSYKAETLNFGMIQV